MALAAFLELALISSALLARASAMAGRPAGADAGAVWVFSGVSGLFSAAHELIGPLDPATGQRGWQHDSLSLLAAGVRIAAPLVAAWLWERVLVSARRAAAARSATQIRADRRLLAFARSAQTLRRLLESQTASERQIRRARQRFDRRHVALLRRVPATDPKLRAAIAEWLTELFCADTLYLDCTPPSAQNLSDALTPVADSPDTRTHAADISARAAGAMADTSVGVSDSVVTFPSTAGQVSVSRSDTDRDRGQVSDTTQGLATSARQMADTVPSEVSDTLSQSLNGSGTTQAMTGQGRPTTDTAAITPASCGAGPDSMSDSPGAVPTGVADTAETCPRAFTDASATSTSDEERLSDAVAIVRTHGHLSGSDMAKQMARSGHPMSERTGLRWRDRAEDDRQQRQALAPAG
ncbi:MAG: hypothetical protein IMZ75_07740 [Actinobacteria bacterium]|nr:hypothetical protein [Actinomycetota bacterium]